MLMRLTQLLRSKKRKNSDMENLQEAIAKIESHEREHDMGCLSFYCGKCHTG